MRKRPSQFYTEEEIESFMGRNGRLCFVGEERKERPIRWNILWNRFVKRFKGASVSEEEVFLWLKKQPEFKSTGKEKK